ncbi:hypothetical protein CSC03_2173 [Enterobacter hormaechei]|nr:hypothetical protein CSC03_2173 [Enterobacter hormaechei]
MFIPLFISINKKLINTVHFINKRTILVHYLHCFCAFFAHPYLRAHLLM